MIGKKDNHNIFNQYKQVILEQAESNEFLSLINKIKACSLDQTTKDKVIEMVKAQMEHGMGDADAAGYSSYPEAKPAIDQDDAETANEQDPKFAEELAKARKEQQEKYPEKEESEESPAVAEIKKELNAAIAAGDQKKANELFDELLKFGASIRKKSTPAPARSHYPLSKPAPSPKPSPDWHKRSTPAMMAFSQGATGQK